MEDKEILNRREHVENIIFFIICFGLQCLGFAVIYYWIGPLVGFILLFYLYIYECYMDNARKIKKAEIHQAIKTYNEIKNK